MGRQTFEGSTALTCSGVDIWTNTGLLVDTPWFHDRWIIRKTLDAGSLFDTLAAYRG